MQWVSHFRLGTLAVDASRRPVVRSRATRGHRGTGAQGHRGTGAQGHRGTGAQGHTPNLGPDPAERPCRQYACLRLGQLHPGDEVV